MNDTASLKQHGFRKVKAKNLRSGMTLDGGRRIDHTEIVGRRVAVTVRIPNDHGTLTFQGIWMAVEADVWAHE